MMKTNLVFNKLLKSVLGIVIVIVVFVFPGVTIGEVSFTPIQPGPCLEGTYLLYEYYVGGGYGAWELPNSQADQSHYMNNLNNTRIIVGNAYSSILDFTSSHLKRSLVTITLSGGFHPDLLGGYLDNNLVDGTGSAPMVLSKRLPAI